VRLENPPGNCSIPVTFPTAGASARSHALSASSASSDNSSPALTARVSLIAVPSISHLPSYFRPLDIPAAAKILFPTADLWTSSGPS
jgi:hypothetical protein